MNYMLKAWYPTIWLEKLAMYVDFMGHFISSLFFFPRFYVLPYFRPTLTYTKFSTNSQSDEVEQQRHPVGARTHTNTHRKTRSMFFQMCGEHIKICNWVYGPLFAKHTQKHTQNIHENLPVEWNTHSGWLGRGTELPQIYAHTEHRGALAEHSLKKATFVCHSDGCGALVVVTVAAVLLFSFLHFVKLFSTFFFHSSLHQRKGSVLCALFVCRLLASAVSVTVMATTTTAAVPAAVVAVYMLPKCISCLQMIQAACISHQWKKS